METQHQNKCWQCTTMFLQTIIYWIFTFLQVKFSIVSWDSNVIVIWLCLGTTNNWFRWGKHPVLAWNTSFGRYRNIILLSQSLLHNIYWLVAWHALLLRCWPDWPNFLVVYILSIQLYSTTTTSLCSRWIAEVCQHKNKMHLHIGSIHRKYHVVTEMIFIIHLWLLSFLQQLSLASADVKNRKHVEKKVVVALFL